MSNTTQTSSTFDFSSWDNFLTSVESIATTSVVNPINQTIQNVTQAASGLPQTQQDISTIANVTEYIKKYSMYFIIGVTVLIVGVILLLRRKK